MTTRNELVAQLKNLKFDQTSNLKFYKLFWTRLIDEGFSPEQASLVAEHVEYDFSNIPEDNDSLGEVATLYAAYCAQGLRYMQLNNYKDIKPLLRFFQPPVALKIDVL